MKESTRQYNRHAAPFGAFRDKGEEFVFENVGDACKLLQRELARRAQMRLNRKGYTYKSIAAQAGLCNSTLYKIADGTTKWPMLRTCILIFHALGFELLVRRK